MIISNLTGGLGNQMFQYALGRHLAIKNKTQLKLHFTNALFCTQRQYELHVFNIKAEIATDEDLKKLGIVKNRVINRMLYLIDERLGISSNKNIITQRFPYKFDPSILDSKDNTYIQGYWQDERYFKQIEKIIRDDFTFKGKVDFKNQEMADLIKKTNSVSIHVRRGDYAKYNSSQMLDISYYNNAINLIKRKMKHSSDLRSGRLPKQGFGVRNPEPNAIQPTSLDSWHSGSGVKDPVFFVFSDDIEWCKQNLKIRDKVFYVKGNLPCDDMILMSLCKHNIIANSSFSLWGTWLNKNSDKIVIIPNKWQTI